MHIKSVVYICAIVAGVAAEGIAPEPTTPPTLPSDTDVNQIAPRQCATVTTVVTGGDTLSHIAQQLGVGICNLATSNNIVNVNSIYVHETLRVHRSGCEAAHTGPTCPVTRRPSTTRTARAGDTFWSYALSQGIPVAAVEAANTGVPAHNIPVGRVITVPAS
ncbi:hypothetical protein OPT61_g4351 [Boeremia exigua]|uniref:Uncharacterized protein n=1 Tax=Boeremia exigua TaxID=749465 RepID=A0ACC2IEI7_9PLEO|nr:hypothetical protein OPT61_g4351 [Boeremia exigua]